MEIIPQPEWKELIEKLIKNRGTALLLGVTDSGKSMLARYLIEKFLAKGVVVSLLPKICQFQKRYINWLKSQ